MWAEYEPEGEVQLAGKSRPASHAIARCNIFSFTLHPYFYPPVSGTGTDGLAGLSDLKVLLYLARTPDREQTGTR